MDRAGVDGGPGGRGPSRRPAARFARLIEVDREERAGRGGPPGSNDLYEPVAAASRTSKTALAAQKELNRLLGLSGAATAKKPAWPATPVATAPNLSHLKLKIREARMNAEELLPATSEIDQAELDQWIPRGGPALCRAARQEAGLPARRHVERWLIAQGLAENPHKIGERNRWPRPPPTSK